MQPDVSQLAEQVKSCLQESDEVPRDITKLFDSSLFKIDTSTVPRVIKYVVLSFLHSCFAALMNEELCMFTTYHDHDLTTLP